MGNKKSSPKVDTSGSNDTTIINTQDFHTEQHESHSTLLWIVLTITGLQLLITIFKIVEKRIRRDALRKAKSIANIDV
ncbi:hypothetical protein RP20_CCG026491 [Aedes albopictus]|nr:hypothetical protein RP20_CCG026491 [Aedes albopictus]